jgi:hypothetical protein
MVELVCKTLLLELQLTTQVVAVVALGQVTQHHHLAVMAAVEQDEIPLVA